MTSQHTPTLRLPLRVDAATDRAAVILDGNGETIARMSCLSIDMVVDVQRANAIVRACNHHEELVSILRSTAAYLAGDTEDRDHMDFGELDNAVSALLARIRKEG